MKLLRVSSVNVGRKTELRNPRVLVFLFYTSLFCFYSSIFNVKYIIVNI